MHNSSHDLLYQGCINVEMRWCYPDDIRLFKHCERKCEKKSYLIILLQVYCL